jgi:hypothetical protein
LKTKRSHSHRGELLKKAVDNSEIKITVLVKRMGISRGSYYNHIESADLSFELLEQYGKILNHDFRGDIPEMKKFVTEEPEPEYGPPKNMKEALEQIDYWRNKYIKLLEKMR